MIIIIILKFYLEIDLKPYIFKSCVRLIIDPSQYKDKNYYYHNFKTQRRGQPEVRSMLWVWMVNPG